MLAVVEGAGLGVRSGAPLLVLDASVSDVDSGVVPEEGLKVVAAPADVVVVAESVSSDCAVETRGSVELPVIAMEVEKGGSEDGDKISSLLDCVLLASLLVVGLLVVSDSGTGVVDVSVDNTLVGEAEMISLLLSISPSEELVALSVTVLLELVTSSVDDTVMLVLETPVSTGLDVDESSSAVLLLLGVTDVLDMRSELELSELTAALELSVKSVLELELASREVDDSSVELDGVLELDVVSELNAVLVSVSELDVASGLNSVLVAVSELDVVSGLNSVLVAVSDVELGSSIELDTVTVEDASSVLTSRVDEDVEEVVSVDEVVEIRG